MQQVPFPEMDFATEQNAAEILISFYQDLGWNLRDTIDPKLIEINDQQWKDICDRFNALPREAGEVPAGFVWMNSGPSASADVPYGQVRIEARAFERLQEAPTAAEREPRTQPVAHQPLDQQIRAAKERATEKNDVHPAQRRERDSRPLELGM